MCGHAGGRYLQLAALLRQKNQHASLILLRVALPADNAGFFQPFQELAERAGVQPDARAEPGDREAILFPQHQQYQILRRSALAASAGADRASSWQASPRQKPHRGLLMFRLSYHHVLRMGPFFSCIADSSCPAPR